jgi:NADH dehydrogenase FAD-containing subunit
MFNINFIKCNLICIDDPTPHFFPFTHEYSTKEFTQCGMASRVTVVDGKMVSIDRERKLIALQNSNAVLRYDYLIITAGLQV